MAEVPVSGRCDERFAPVRNQLELNVANGLEAGASVAVFIDGQPVVDLWAGTAADGAPWERDTIVNVWSSTKTMTALCALVLADRGELDVDTPVAHYWPEFAAAGKDGVLVRHLLGHTSGLCAWTEPMAPEDLYDWDKATSLLAAQAPLWEPGTASGYHGMTFGYLVGEVVRRITGVSLGAFLAKEIAGPLGADFHVGLDPVHFDRVSALIPPPPMDVSSVDPDSIQGRTLFNPRPSAEQTWTDDWRRAEIPAANGHGNAASMAQIQSVLACGGEVNGVRVLSEAGCRAVFTEQSNGIDLVAAVPIRFGLGYGLNSEAFPISPNANTAFWGGWGGSIVVADLDARMVVAYAMNKMVTNSGALGDPRGASMVLSTYMALQQSR